MSKDEFRKASKNVWNKMAQGWDSNREYMWETSKPVGEWLVRKLAPMDGQTLLELAAGVGDTGFVAARLMGTEGRLISTDFSPSMVEGARRRADELDITNAEFHVMDAENMGLDTDSVDGVLCRWGYMLMSDPAVAFKETRRVLKPGGRLCFSVFAGPEKNPWAALPARTLIEEGFMEPPASGSPGILALGDNERLERLLYDAGFSGHTIEEVSITWRHRNFEGYWQFLTEVAGAIATLIEALTPGEQAAARDAMQAAVSEYQTGSEIALPGVTINVVTQ
jgi:ubiquinone/menaquinone biosynthesis C-methylase UbiE